MPTPTEQVAEIKSLGELHAALKETLNAGANANAEKLAALETRLAELETAQRSAIDSRTDKASIGYKPTGNPEKDFSWLRFFRGVANNWEKGTEKFPEYELTMEATTKAMSAGVDSAGGFLVAPEIFVDQIIPALEPRVMVPVIAVTAIAEPVPPTVTAVAPVLVPLVWTSIFWSMPGCRPNESCM